MVPLHLTTAWLPVRAAIAWLTEAWGPWSCDPDLRAQVGETELSMAVTYARPVLDALSTLLVSAAAAAEEVIR